MPHGRQAAGFSLVELMIAVTLSLLLGSVIVTVFLSSRQSFAQDELVLAMQDDGRQAVREIVNDLSMAGYLADLVLPGSVTLDPTLAVAPDCGPVGVPNWMYQLMEAGTERSLTLSGVDNATGAAANASFSCIAPGEIVAGTDVISVKRVAGAAVTGARSASTVYLRANGTVGLLFREPLGAAPAIEVPMPFSEWEYRPSIYYIRSFAVTAGDGIPTLCRKVMQYGGGGPSVVTECLAQGVENLQLEYGLDTDGDGAPNLFLPNPSLDQLQTVVEARIYVLMRTSGPDRRYTNDKSYSISNAPVYTPADNFYRRVYSVTVGLRNLRNLQLLRS